MQNRMHYILGILGIIVSVLLLKYRERAGDLIGEADWMGKLGGVYNVIIIFALFLFIWSVAVLTNTTYFFLAPLKWILPGLAPQPTVVPQGF
jgi:multisubunit Na+/H+ antiporter MnhF subunit